jgi:hypothetical protein
MSPLIFRTATTAAFMTEPGSSFGGISTPSAAALASRAGAVTPVEELHACAANEQMHGERKKDAGLRFRGIEEKDIRPGNDGQSWSFSRAVKDGRRGERNGRSLPVQSGVERLHPAEWMRRCFLLAENSRL